MKHITFRPVGILVAAFALNAAAGEPPAPPDRREWKEPGDRRNPEAEQGAPRDFGSRADTNNGNALRPTPTNDAKPTTLTPGLAETPGLQIVAGEPPAPRQLDWRLPTGARIEGDRLIAEIPAEDGPRNIWCSAELNIADALAAMKCVAAHVRFRAENVSEPKEPWQGVKVQFMFESPSGGGRIYRSVNTARGTYGWTNVVTRISPLRDASVKDGVATFILGLEACTGRAEFDLSALRIEYEAVGLTPVNQDWVVRYPEEAHHPAAMNRGLGGQELHLVHHGLKFSMDFFGRFSRV